MSTRKSRSRRALVVALTAALGALAIAGLTLGYVLAGGEKPAPAAKPSVSPKSTSCAEVIRQYNWWNQETRSLVGLRHLGKAEAKAGTEKLIADTKTLLQTMDLYREEPVRKFSEAIIDYETELHILAEKIDKGLKADTLVIGGTLLAQQAADDAYTAYLKSSC